jgi:hypothetical protein
MATNKSQVNCYKPSNLCVWVSMSLCHSKTDQNSRKIRSQICTSGQIHVSAASSGTTATNQDSHIRVLLASCRSLHYRNQLHMFVARAFSFLLFFGCMMVWCVALILLLVAKGGCFQKSDLLLCLYKAKFVMQDSEREGRGFFSTLRNGVGGQASR